MARATGSNFVLTFKEEVTYGTQPAGTGYTQLPCFTFDVGAQQDRDTDIMLSAGLTRNVGDPFLGTLSVSGDARVPLDLTNTGHWLKALMGAPVTVAGGGGNYTHTFKSGPASLPSWTVEKGFPDITSYAIMTGIQVNSFEMTVDPTGPAEWSLNVMGSDETISGSSADAAPTLATITRFQKPTAAIKRNGSTLANITAGTIRMSNGLEPVRTIRSDNKIEGIDPGPVTGGGSITARLSSTQLITDAIADTVLAIEYSLTISPDKSITFTYPRCYLSRPRVGIQGPGGIELVADFQAANDQSEACLLKVVLKNQTASY